MEPECGWTRQRPSRGEVTPLSCSLCNTKFNERAPPILAPTLPPIVRIHCTCTYHAKSHHPGPSENGGVSIRCPAVCVTPLTALHCRVRTPYNHSSGEAVAFTSSQLIGRHVAGSISSSNLQRVGTTASRGVVPSCGHKASKDNLPFLPSQSTWTAGRAQPRGQQRLSTFLVLCSPWAQIHFRHFSL